MTGTAETDTYTPLSAHGNGGNGPGTRQVQVKTSHDPGTGLVTQVADLGDVSDSSQARCTRYSYPVDPVAGRAAGLPRRGGGHVGVLLGGQPAAGLGHEAVL